MNLFDISAVLITAAALGSYINHKYIKFPSSIGLLLLAMGAGFFGILLKKSGLISEYYIEDFLSSINFNETVFHGMLSFILFAGALQINLDDLKSATLPVAITATISTLLSAIIIGLLFFFGANLFGFPNINLLYAMLFGVILSPTDPIAVLSIIKKMRASKQIETTIVGESLFNDCIAIVLFIAVLQLISVHAEVNAFSVTKLLFLEVGGGIVFGGLIGWLAYQMLLRIDNYSVELLITLAIATGGYALAERLNFSAPLAMVIAGIIIGNQGRTIAMSEQSRKSVSLFWEALDETFNAVLFLLLGLEMIVINASLPIVILGLICILIALIARLISLVIPLTIMKPFYRIKRGTIIILTWGGLRGALSIAMVLSLQEQSIKELFLPCIYFVVIFSIAIQGLTFEKVLKRYNLKIVKEKAVLIN